VTTVSDVDRDEVESHISPVVVNRRQPLSVRMALFRSATD
jgi:hypothetical protein